jgi:hypothetical protein
LVSRCVQYRQTSHGNSKQAPATRAEIQKRRGMMHTEACVFAFIVVHHVRARPTQTVVIVCIRVHVDGTELRQNACYQSPKGGSTFSEFFFLAPPLSAMQLSPFYNTAISNARSSECLGFCQMEHMVPLQEPLTLCETAI